MGEVLIPVRDSKTHRKITNSLWEKLGLVKFGYPEGELKGFYVLSKSPFSCQERFKIASLLHTIIREQRISFIEIAVLQEDTNIDIILKAYLWRASSHRPSIKGTKSQ